ncbi:MAG: hypothetical protein KF740_01410 [Ramlibacter sp.]|nr:hypothetical protein [Ramlibacter sp.]
MNMHAFETEMTRMVISGLVLYAIGFAFSMWALYIVIKYAIRDGINESRLANNWERTVKAAGDPEPKAPTVFTKGR